MAIDFTNLIAATTKTTDAETAAKNLLLDLKTKLDKALTDLANAGVSAADLAQLQSISDGLGSNADALAEAVVINTPTGTAAFKSKK